MTLLRALLLLAILPVPLVGLHSATPSNRPSAAMRALSTPVANAAAGATNARAAADSRLAHATLEELKATYRHLDGVTVRFAATPHGEEAIAYYADGRIVINPAHSVYVPKILKHEVWHIIDWRDNGRLDWGENLPPSDLYLYAKRQSP